jgi:hypothetical protein
VKGTILVSNHLLFFFDEKAVGAAFHCNVEGAVESTQDKKKSELKENS